MGLEQPTTPQEDLPEWLKNLRREKSNGGEGDEFDPELADAPTQEMPAVGPAATSEDEGDAEEIPDWLNKIREAEEQNAPSSAEIPGFQQEAGDAEAGEADWLETLRTQTEQDETGDEELEVGGQGDFLERIRQLKETEGREEDVETDWLSASMASAAEEEDDDAEGDVPDWLSGISAEHPESPARDEPAGDAFEGLTAGDFIDDQEGDAASGAGAAVEAEFPGLPGRPAGDLPAWLADLQQSTVFPDPDEPPALMPDEADAASEQTQETVEKPELSGAPPATPDWVAEEQAAPGVDDDTDLAPADLPEWLQAMRPSGYSSPSKTRPLGSAGAQETVGPLAGLRSVLPAEPEVVQFGKTPQFSGRVHVTEGQKANASLFENLIKEETEAVVGIPQSTSLPQRILRFIVAGVLFLSLLVPVFSGSVSIPLPMRSAAPENIDVQSLINGLSPDSRVLLAFDYQPGFSGEMDAALSAVVDHLLIKGARLALISTSPTGTSLGEFFLVKTQASHNPVVLDLGYLAGGISALQGFAQNPRDMLPSIDVDSLNDYALLLVITDDPDVARSWVEQVQPVLADQATGQTITPMIAVTSAQAEPFVRPYYETSPKQISGLVSGLLGGAYYENAIGRSHAARAYWNAFSWGLTIAVLLIVIGGFYNLAAYLLKRRALGPKGIDQ